MENYYRVLELIEENKHNISQGHYVEMMEKFKKSKDHIDKMADKLDDEKKEVKKKMEFYNKKIKEMDKDKRIKLLKQHNQTLDTKCKAYQIALREFDVNNVRNIFLDDFGICPLTDTILYEIRANLDCDEEDHGYIRSDNMVKCCVCNIRMNDEIQDHQNPHYRIVYTNNNTHNKFYCKDCCDIIDI